MSIYTCPHCGKKAFGALTKATAGQMNSKGKPCMECGRLCVNGKGATIFNAIVSLIGIICMVAVFLSADKSSFIAYWEIPIQASLVVAIFLIPRLANAFFFKLTPSIRLGVQ